MRHSWFGTAIFIAVGSCATGCGSEACEGEDCRTAPLERFEGSAVSPDPLPYASGMDLTVDGVYGNIDTAEGPPGEVSVVFEPFNWRENDQEERALDEIENQFDYSFEASGNAISVTTSRLGKAKGLGADITVVLPPEFDGALVLRNQSDGPSIFAGDVVVMESAQAHSVDVSTERDGSCFISSDGSVVSTRARCAGRIDAIGVSDHIDLVTQAPYGEVNVIFRSVAGEQAGGSATTDEGDIRLHYPDGADFEAQADLGGLGLIQLLTIDSTICESEGDERVSMSITCGAGGPNYALTAGVAGEADEPGELDVIAIFRSF